VLFQGFFAQEKVASCRCR